MKKAVFIISVILLFQMAIFGQDKDVCVEIKAVDKIGVGEILKVTADLKVDFLTAPQKLYWKTSKGQTLTTDDFTAQFATNKEDAGKTIKVSLEFEGLPDNCLKVYEKEVQVQIPNFVYEKPISNSINWNDEKKNLNKKIIQLQKDKTSNFLIMIFTKNPSSKSLENRKSKIMNYLIKDKKIAKERIKIEVQESDLEITQYWVVKEITKPSKNIIKN